MRDVLFTAEAFLWMQPVKRNDFGLRDIDEGKLLARQFITKPTSMSRNGAILIIEDDHDDQEIIKEIFEELQVPNTLSMFSRCKEAFHYLKTSLEKPFLILCDVNIPEMDGLEFRKKMVEDGQLRQKAIPFLFFSTSSQPKMVTEAFAQMSIQGFFQKRNNYEELKNMLKVILDYWQLSLHPVVSA